MCFFNFLLKIWGHLPCCALTDDNNFLEVEIRKATDDGKNHKYRLSLINLLFGEINIQFFSFAFKHDSNEKFFNLIRKYRMSDMKLFGGEDYEKKKEEYEEHCYCLSEDDVVIEKEALSGKLQFERDRVTTSNNKINLYLTVLLVVVPIISTQIKWKEIPNNCTVSIIIGALLAYSLLNICCWIFRSILVRSISLSSFEDLKNANNKQITYNSHLYCDWLQTKRQADIYVSFVINIQEWAIASIIFGVFFAIEYVFDFII